MKKFFALLAFSLLVVGFSGIAYATNGDNLIAIGPIARAMGGVGIADPQDAISAVFANPAAMCFGPYCPGSEFNFAGTMFMPTVDAKVSATALGPLPAYSVSADSEKKVYAIPAIGLSVPISNDWRFGLAAYGVSGLGVDYRGTNIDNPSFFNFGGGMTAPLVTGEFTQLQIMKFAPSIAYRATDKLSVGLALHIDYASLDMRSGSSFNYGVGAQLGVIYKPTDMISLGLTYITPQEVNHKNVINNGGSLFDLKLESPQQVGVGISVEPVKDMLLVEVDGRWINWKDANGYKTFDWKDQWVIAVGAQYKPTKELALRIGYNYANNPVREHNGWDGSFGLLGPNDTVQVQDTVFPRYYYETFRIIGFPAVVTQHITAGVGYEFSKKFAVNAGYTHAFKNTISENGTNPFGQSTTLQSSLSEDSVEFGITYRF